MTLLSTERCACGCGNRLSRHGASPWFATQECQTRWYRQFGDEPDYLAIDERRRARLGHIDPAEVLAYRRWCDNCPNFARPMDCLLSDDGSYIERCERCYGLFEPPYFDHAIRPGPPDVWVLQLWLNEHMVQSTVALMQLQVANDPIEYTGARWQSMERRLARTLHP